jgi:hypothetical protein
MKPRFVALGALLLLAAACTDDKKNRQRSSLITGPSKPALSLRNLPANASTICVASVRKRDQLLAKNPAAPHAALDATIDDVCQ